MSDTLDGKPDSWWVEKSANWTAGATVAEAVACAKDYNQKGYRVIVNSIADVAESKEQLEQMRDSYLALISALSKGGAKAAITLRLTNLGLEFSEKEAEKALLAVLKGGSDKKLAIELDMEERPYVEKTIKLALRSAQAGYSFRLCVQSAVKNILGQIKEAQNIAGEKISFRIVTGSCYPETKELGETETIIQFHRLMDTCGVGSAVGTHITERLLSAKARGMETQVLKGFEDEQPQGSVDTIYACFGDWKTNPGIRGYIKRREQTV